MQFTLVYIMQFILQNQQSHYQKKSGVTYLADQGPLAHFPWEIAALSSSYELTSTILLQEKKFLYSMPPQFSQQSATFERMDI